MDELMRLAANCYTQPSLQAKWIEAVKYLVLESKPGWKTYRKPCGKHIIPGKVVINEETWEDPKA